MKVFLTGGTGFIGNTLTGKLLDQGHQVTILTRKRTKIKKTIKGVSYIEGEPTREGEWQKEVSKHEVLINLAGASIFRRWTKKAKEGIRNSRILTTRNLVEAMAGSNGKERTLISASAIGYYGFHGHEELDEENPSGNDFLASLCRDWEDEALRGEGIGVRVLICRLGIVLGKKGGALNEMLPIFKKGMGSPLGSGRQWFSWIHEKELVEIFLFLLNHRDLKGSYNCSSPQPVQNKEFTRALQDELGKRALMPAVPGFIIKALKGEFGSVLLQGQRVLPKKLMDAGYIFRFPNLRDALHDLLL
ncbi:MAG: TIGR01777 family oxidoreductase [Thermodesulfobacteriota bacterium]|nr:TIGR01777 family oxidoreductase [Thermodesulfobacteriota bacterium]